MAVLLDWYQAWRTLRRGDNGVRMGTSGGTEALEPVSKEYRVAPGEEAGWECRTRD